MKSRAIPDVAALISVAESANLSRAEIARRSGLTPATITRYANGDRGVLRPPLGTYLALKSVVDDLPRRVFPNGNK